MSKSVEVSHKLNHIYYLAPSAGDKYTVDLTAYLNGGTASNPVVTSDDATNLAISSVSLTSPNLTFTATAGTVEGDYVVTVKWDADTGGSGRDIAIPFKVSNPANE